MRDVLAASVSICEEPLLLQFVPKYEEEARPDGERLFTESTFDEFADLRLCEVLLERAAGRQHPVAPRFGACCGLLPWREHRNHQALACELECTSQSVDALLGLFDHIEDVPEIDNVSGRELCVRSKVGIPTDRADPSHRQDGEVVTSATAVVEDGLGAVQETVSRCSLKGD